MVSLDVVAYCVCYYRSADLVLLRLLVFVKSSLRCVMIDGGCWDCLMVV